MQVISFVLRSVWTGSGFKLINHTPRQAKGCACRQPQPPGYHTMPPGMATGSERIDGGDFVVLMLASTPYLAVVSPLLSPSFNLSVLGS